MWLLAWPFLCVCVGIAARRRFDRSGWGWFALAMLISPLFAFLMLLSMGKAKAAADWTRKLDDRSAVLTGSLPCPETVERYRGALNGPKAETVHVWLSESERVPMSRRKGQRLEPFLCLAAGMLMLAAAAHAQSGPPPEVAAMCTRPGAIEPDPACLKQAQAAYLSGAVMQGTPPPFVGPSPQVANYGYAGTRCDGVGNEQDQFGAENWVMGYWSGLNDELAAWTHASSIVGHSAGDGAPILAAIAGWCHQHPANTIKDATIAIFTDYRQRGG